VIVGKVELSDVAVRHINVPGINAVLKFLAALLPQQK